MPFLAKTLVAAFMTLWYFSLFLMDIVKNMNDYSFINMLTKKVSRFFALPLPSP